MMKIVFFALMLSFVSNCAGIDSKEMLVSVKGIDAIILKSTENYHVYSSKGIGKLKINLAKGDSAKLSFFYADKKPFKQFEGISILNYPAGSNISEQLLKVGELSIKSGQLFFHPRKTAVNWEINFVDYFRN